MKGRRAPVFFQRGAVFRVDGLDANRRVGDDERLTGSLAMFPTEPFLPSIDGFEILERLGAGAFGEVFLARSRGGQLVAVKTIARTQADSEASAEMFSREATICARLRHPCIVQMRAFLEQAGFTALVFEYVPGVALARVLRLCAQRGVRLPDRAAFHVVERVLSALAYAHAFRGEDGEPTPIVHRDLSPSNVLLDWSGGVKIADFGIAKVVGVSPATRFGLVKGTLGCMAPEQARGEPVDERADVYAAALLAWRLATGRVPFGKHQRDEFELLRAMRNPRINPLSVIRPDLPTPVFDAIARALEPDPAERTIRAEELANVLRTHADVASGARELGTLLVRWTPALRRAVKRTSLTGSELSVGKPRVTDHTVRYEEAALAFDDEPLPDGPTFEAHALPLESAPPQGPVSVDVIDPPQFPLPPETSTSRSHDVSAGKGDVAVDPTGPTRPTRPTGMWALVIVALGCVLAGLLANLMAARMR